MNRDFKGVWIPKDIWLDKNLTWMEKLMLVEIHSLDNIDGCFASNAYFAEFFNLSISRISEIIRSLALKGYLKGELIYEGKQVIKRILRVSDSIRNTNGGIRFSEGGIQNTEGGYSENTQDNNTILNNTINKNINNREKFEKMIEPFIDILGSNYNDFLEYWAEPSKSGKLRYEAEKFFDVKRRINTWLKNSNNYGNKSTTSITTKSQQRINDLKSWVSNANG